MNALYTLLRHVNLNLIQTAPWNSRASSEVLQEPERGSTKRRWPQPPPLVSGSEAVLSLVVSLDFQCKVPFEGFCSKHV